MLRKSCVALLAIIAIPALPTVALADDVVPVVAVPEVIAEPAVITEPALQTADTLTDTDLGDLRGGDAIVVGTQTLTATNSGSVINGNYAAGNIGITDNALSNFNGLGNLVINTGAQNNLQSAMNVTINIAP